MKHICPNCNSYNIVPIFYGVPQSFEIFKKQVEHKEIMLGGITQHVDSPTYYCLDCHTRYGVQFQAYEEHTSELSIEIQPLLEKKYQLKFQKVNDVYHLEIHGKEHTYHILSEEQGKAFLKEFYKSKYPHWNETYQGLDQKEKSCSWRIEVQHRDGLLTSEGDYFPMHFKHIENLVSNYPSFGYFES